MTSIILTLVLGGSITEHTISNFSYDAGAETLQYTEAGVLHTVQDIVVFNFSGSMLLAETDEIFKGGFD